MCWEPNKSHHGVSAGSLSYPHTPMCWKPYKPHHGVTAGSLLHPHTPMCWEPYKPHHGVTAGSQSHPHTPMCWEPPGAGCIEVSLQSGGSQVYHHLGNPRAPLLRSAMVK
ncbi:hypothetical protein DPMN_043998 [Dreissena polymorpha]|uniref:Uncharacterized protein n=1 Tax=Dreissena polymorpha TaxID=45954 RepID=A0A9D4D3Q0_DREPO|nr:hypothetical protein DPMN_043998 [Dreissena polymorpha]